ncbi:MAG: hypothetical protein C3F02_01065 [Parcubacteria group bacterium]|nr:MAG: hypothetical protein C3F02_01065 [Parcubacteria group bacterium]
MNKQLRRLLYLSFILIFSVLAPIFIAYSLGYRYRFDTNMVEKNGAFYIKSYPGGADIYLDGQPSRHRTPDQITEIRPGSYLVTIIKEAFVPWQKKLKVLPGETTFIQDVVLFFSDIKKNSLGSGSTNYLVNRTKNQYAYVDNKSYQLFITDIEQDKNYQIYDFINNYQLLDWSPDNQKILLGLAGKYYIFDINQKNLQTLSLPIADKVSWDSKNSRILWLSTKQGLYTYDLEAAPAESLSEIKLNKKIYDFAVQDEYLIIEYSLGDKYFLEQLDKNDLQPLQTSENITPGKIHLLLADRQRFILTVGSILYIKTLEKEALTIPVTLADIHDDRLLISNGNEIILYNFKEDWQDLIDRSTQIVSDLLWHPNGSYFITEINSRTNLTEVDSRDKRNTINIIDNPLKKSYIFNKKGDKLFVLTPEENFYLTIQ